VVAVADGRGDGRGWVGVGCPLVASAGGGLAIGGRGW
jgi:hypothetical protein